MYFRRIAALLLALAAAFGAVTWHALEGNDVAVLRTRDPSGAWRETRVWIAEEGGTFWVEAATPERPFYRDLQTTPEAELVHRRATLSTRAELLPDAEGHARIRSLLRAKYGWADRWIGMLQDTSRSVAVRLSSSIASGNAS